MAEREVGEVTATRAPNLGKRLKPGDTFTSTTKSMTKKRGKYNAKHGLTYEVLKTGEQRFFVKGKRRYFCEVLGMVEMRTGFNMWLIDTSNPRRAVRWWQFTYLVKVLAV